MTTLAGMLDAAPSAVIAIDATGTIRYGSPLVASLWGYEREELLGRPVWMLVPERLVDEYTRVLESALTQDAPGPVAAGREFIARHRDGHEFPVEASLLTADSGHGDIWVVAGVTDVTERVAAQERLETLSRAYRTLADLNEALVRAADVTEMYEETCRVAVEVGGYLGAWVAVRGTGGAVVPAATAGVAGAFVSQIELSLDPGLPGGRAPAVVALREGRAYWSEDVLADPRTARWRQAAHAAGIRACASLPLSAGENQVVAALTLYSGSPGFFDEANAGAA